MAVFIDPFADMTPMLARGLRWDYPAIGGVEADLLLVTHEHVDHNGVESVGGDPVPLRSTAGRLEAKDLLHASMRRSGLALFGRNQAALDPGQLVLGGARWEDHRAPIR
jgi:hypothetical protein